MEEKELSGLKQMHSQVRLTLLASLVLFLIGLFALVSRWDSAVAIIIFACIFRLGAVWWMRRRYNAAWTRSFVKAAAEKVINPADYQARERIPEMLVSDLGFAPEVRLVPNSLRFHVLRGELAGCSVTKVEYEKNDKGEVSYRIYRNDHWLKTESTGIRGGMTDGGR